MIFRLIQISVLFGTIWFFTEVAPADASLGAKTLLGVVFAFLVTVLLVKCGDLIARGKQRLRKALDSRGTPNFVGRRTD